MPRLLLKHGGILRHLASIEATHDGSISLALVRDGVNESGWEWAESPDGQTPVQKKDFESPKDKTKKITIHTSGRVNHHHHEGNGQTVFIPCLLDLAERVPIVVYVVPGAQFLDEVKTPRATDQVSELASEIVGHLAFEFSVVPAKLPGLPGEISRSIIEGHYGVVCVLVLGDAGTLKRGVPCEAFTTLHPTLGLPSQAIAEDVAFLRFKRLMHANAVREAVQNSPRASEVKEEVIESIIAEGPGLLAPNGEGVWTVICSVPMRIKPELIVKFVDPRYKAELVDFAPADRRLEKVRVRFKVFDQRSNSYVKMPVEILSISLDARL